MKKEFVVFVFLLYTLLFFLNEETFAIEDPKLSPNNKFGVHILFASEIEEAAKLINSSGGDWGYVTIPIQAGDKDLLKWQQFMDDAKRLHVIPIIRLATEGDYFKNSVWRKPSFADVLDFSNFLNSLDWPTINRYVLVFNEPNRADEWGGLVDSSDYANILSYAVETFKSKNQDFFIISAGLDNAAENIEGESRNQYSFMQEMYNAVPNVFNQIDAISSHSYPNPGFRQPSWVLTKRSIASFIHEKRLADLLGDKNLPVFITETGWSQDVVSDSQIANYFEQAFESVWASDGIIAVTPFVLFAGTGPFIQFSLISKNGEYSEVYKAIKETPKIKGNPKEEEVKTEGSALKNQTLPRTTTVRGLPTRDFTSYNQFDKESIAKAKAATAAEFVKWFLRI